MNVVTLEASVIVPTRDAAAALPATIASIGDDPTLEILIIDCGSDGTADWVAEVADPRLRWLPGPSRGLTAARNLGIAEAEAPLVAFLDAGQRWVPGKLALQLALHRRQPEIGFSFGAHGARAATDPSEGGARVLAGDALARIFAAAPIEASTVVARTALVRAVGGFTEDVGPAADWDLWLHLSQCAPVGWLPSPLTEGPAEPWDARRMASARRVAAVWRDLVAAVDPSAAREGVARVLAASAEAAMAEGDRLAALRFRLARLRLRSARAIGALRKGLG
ncbi:glycosyl transferase family 2 [Humitalea rosea]|uniref:Glycosyl transferase family 2 n=1 Tax=Humitalea rosea TaxID=990373 RepID=A0A2W7IRW9_9PROT|nr:glycosyltransferase [Humitalea rosea]PZW50351.1 glycosyl transferase family 2 [Humitalea rosea]